MKNYMIIKLICILYYFYHVLKYMCETISYKIRFVILSQKHASSGMLEILHITVQIPEEITSLILIARIQARESPNLLPFARVPRS